MPSKECSGEQLIIYIGGDYTNFDHRSISLPIWWFFFHNENKLFDLLISLIERYANKNKM